jgi:hypothetical protein
MTLEQIEKEVILYTLKFHQNNKTRAASTLGISVRTIDNKLARYNGGDHVHNGQDSVCTETGTHVEPSSIASEEQSMSMRESKKVQVVSLEKTSSGHTRPKTSAVQRTNGERKTEA